MTKADAFVPYARSEMRYIRNLLFEVQSKSQALLQKYQNLGGGSMDGLAGYQWAGAATTEAEFNYAMGLLINQLGTQTLTTLGSALASAENILADA